MALRWVEGFENDFGDTDFDRKYDSYVVPASSWSSGDGRKDPNGQSAGSSAADAALLTPTLVAVADDTWIVGFGFKMPSSASVTEHAAGVTFVLNGSGDQIEFRINSVDSRSAQFRVYRGATLLGSTSGFFHGQWYYFEIRVVIDDASGSYEVRKDGTSIGSGSTLDTKNQTGTGADQVRFKWGVTGGASFCDDIYVIDETGSKNNTWLGDSVAEGLRPNVDGNRVEWDPSSGSTHYVLVDDPAGSPNDTDKVTSQTIGDDDLYGFEDSSLMASSTTVHGVMVSSSAGMEASGSRTLRHRHRDSGGSESTGSNFVVSGTAFDHYFDVFENNPALAVAWSRTNLNNSEFGPEVVA